MSRSLTLFALIAAAGATAGGCGNATAGEAGWQGLLPGLDPARGAVAGEWRNSGEGLRVTAATGGRFLLPFAPEGEYDLRAAFTRHTGQHSVGLVVVHGGRQVVFEVDAWGQHLGGFQNIGGRSIQQNSTRRPNVALQNGRRHTLTVEVRKGSLRGLLDGREIALYRSDGGDCSLPEVWAMPNPRQLGLVAWESDTTFHSVEARGVNGGKVAAVRPGATTPSTPGRPPGAGLVSPAPPGGVRKRVLMIIANYHFFFREYGDPRAEFDRAGFRVTVAAGRRGACVPHSGSGEGAGGGVVQAQVALSEVRAADYDAVLFSGGWGASAYQFAFPGRYNDQAYNGDPATRAQANRIINEFIAQDKFVAALCNGVSVLAWARVNGRSPLAGKRVCAPTRAAAAGLYNGRQASPPCRWHPEVNGAIMSPPGAIGQPGTAADDVAVDGKILTGEDDISAREMGRRLVQLLSR